MDCQRIADDELVERYLNGKLDAAMQDDLEVHILECPECLSRAEALSAIRASLVPKVQEIDLSAKPAHRLQPAWIGVAAAALVAACVFGFYQVRSWTRPPLQSISTHPQPSQVAPAPSATPHGIGAEIHAPGVGASRQKQPAVARNAKNHPSAGAVVTAGVDQNPKVIPPQTSSPQIAAERHNGSEAGVSPFDFTHRTSLMEMSRGTSVEFYALAAVQPPPYIFSDASETGNSSDHGESSGLSQNLLSGHRTLFQDAMVAYGQKRYAEAADLLEDVVEARSKAPEANFYLGICRLMQGRPGDSIAPLKTVMAAPAGTLTQSAHFYLAKAYLQTGDMAKAESEMQLAASLQGSLTREARSIAERIHALRNADATQDQK